MKEKNQNLVEVELSHDVAQGTYANWAILAHSAYEFIIDFLSLMPGVPKPEVKSRIIMTPENMKRLLLVLQDDIRKFEQDNGVIRLPQQRSDLNLTYSLDLEPKGQA